MPRRDRIKCIDVSLHRPPSFGCDSVVTRFAAPSQRKSGMDAFGTGLLIGVNALLGLNQALVKLVNEAFAPIFQSGLRSACAFVLILAYVAARRQTLPLRDGSLPWGLITGALFALEFALLFAALDYTSVARVSLFFYTMPFFVALCAHFMFPGERLNGPRSIGLGLALVGVALGLGVADEDAPAQAWIGDLLALGGAVAWAALTVITRASPLHRSPPVQVLLYQLFVSGVVLIGCAPLFGDLVREVTPTLLGIFSFQVVVIATLGFLVWLWVLAVYPVSHMAAFGLLAPLFGVFFGWLIFDDPITPTFLLALALVSSGILLINRK